MLGLENARRIVQAVADARPRDSAERAGLERVARFAAVAIDNLDLSDQILGTIGTPIQVDARPLPGGARARAPSTSRPRWRSR